jgi:hypothetical protein
MKRIFTVKNNQMSLDVRSGENRNYEDKLDINNEFQLPGLNHLYWYKNETFQKVELFPSSGMPEMGVLL